ncbi:hypothetical protein C1Y41_04555 [Pantoea sp. ICBG 1758]|nr:DUF3168 domain-containing protein [Pantoea sp. ICBG 1758]PPC64883.1 hypothetical protein C1Y41_04555 [Pantoea sp. ICBG 1758]
MNAPIFEVLAQSPDVMKYLGPTILRFYDFANKPEKATYPYGTFQNYAGSPQMFLGTLPDVDMFSLQVDVFAKTAAEARNIALAIRDAIEPHSYITRWGDHVQDDETKSYRYSFDVDWMVLR